MKTFLLLLALMLAATAQASIAQNSIKLFDAMPIDASPDYQTRVFATRQISLSCPAKGPIEATITGPNGGPFIVDNALMINREWAGGKNVFWDGLIADPMFYVGEPMETAYLGIQPLDVSRQIRADGLYTFELLDWSYTFGNTEVYLNTNCWLSNTTPLTETTDATQICHRNMGASGQKTLTVGANAVRAHLAHGDTAGPCSE